MSKDPIDRPACNGGVPGCPFMGLHSHDPIVGEPGTYAPRISPSLGDRPACEELPECSGAQPADITPKADNVPLTDADLRAAGWRETGTLPGSNVQKWRLRGIPTAQMTCTALAIESLCRRREQAARAEARIDALASVGYGVDHHGRPVPPSAILPLSPAVIRRLTAEDSSTRDRVTGEWVIRPPAPIERGSIEETIPPGYTGEVEQRACPHVEVGEPRCSGCYSGERP